MKKNCNAALRERERGIGEGREGRDKAQGRLKRISKDESSGRTLAQAVRLDFFPLSLGMFLAQKELFSDLKHFKIKL